MRAVLVQHRKLEVSIVWRGRYWLPHEEFETRSGTPTLTQINTTARFQLRALQRKQSAVLHSRL